MRHVATVSRAANYLRIHGFYGEFKDKVIIPFCRKYLYKWGKTPIPGSRKQAWKVTHVFARSNFDKTEYRIPGGLLKEFMEFAAYCGYHTGRIKLVDEEVIPGKRFTFKLKDAYKNPMPHQEEWINYQLDPRPVKVNNAATGQGKTFMALFTMVMLGMRTIITIQPRYITTWLNDIDKMIEISPGDLVVWEQSLPLLAEAIDKGRIDPKIIILPTTRISMYLRNTREDPDSPCFETLLKKIRPGYRVVDEGHESFHEVCLSMLYGNLEKFLLLSATLKADDPFLNSMYMAMLPKNIRLKEPDPENYIDIFAYLYQIDLSKFKIKTEQFGAYNDLAVEQSILNSPVLTNFYFEIADKIFRDLYLDIREDGTKCLFFFSLIKMCQVMKEKFIERYPGWDFETFLGTLDKKTPNKYLEHEIVITTPGSCGTGKDIPGLVTTICFHTVFSIQRNKQMIGRLRPLRGKFGDRITPRFAFPVCVDIEKHRECEKKRITAFASKEKSRKVIDSNLALVA